jgi:hypothetical protein
VVPATIFSLTAGNLEPHPRTPALPAVAKDDDGTANRRVETPTSFAGAQSVARIEIRPFHPESRCRNFDPAYK